MAKIEGFSSLVSKLGKRAAEVKPVSVVVSYSASYGVYVHENLEAKHPSGNAKFLEGPARRNGTIYGDIARGVYADTGDMAKALYTAGLALQADSQRECPVDTGALRASANTEVEK